MTDADSGFCWTARSCGSGKRWHSPVRHGTARNGPQRRGAVRGTEDREGSATPPGPAQSCPRPREERHLCHRASRGPDARQGRGRGEEAASIRTLSGLTQSPCAAETAEAAHGGVGLPAGAQDGQRARQRRYGHRGSLGATKDASGTDTEQQQPVCAPRSTLF